MLWEDEEETFKFKPKKLDLGKLDETKIDVIEERLDSVQQQINMISKYLGDVSKRISKVIDTSLSFQEELNDLEKRIQAIRSKVENLENVVPEVELKSKLGRKAG